MIFDCALSDEPLYNEVCGMGLSQEPYFVYSIVCNTPVMTYQLDIPSDLSGSDIAAVFQYLDSQLNTEIVYAFLYGLYSRLGLLLSHPSLHLGIYTGIVAVTLWNICECNISSVISFKLN